MRDEKIIFEQPLNEQIRICLRLEYLFQQVKHFLDKTTIWDSRCALTTILDILYVIDRPDLKSKLTNALRLHTAALYDLEHIKDVDKHKLHEIISKLDQSRDILHSIHGKLGQELRDNDFLNTIKQRLTIPGGSCDYAVPAYHLWLQQPQAQIQDGLHKWLNSFTYLQNIVTLLLKLTRESSQSSQKIAEQGFYQASLSPTVPYQMIRVAIPVALNIYPEISVGRYRISIYFFDLDIETSRKQTTSNIKFDLTECKL